jgi:hypothetical protein
LGQRKEARKMFGEMLSRGLIPNQKLNKWSTHGDCGNNKDANVEHSAEIVLSIYQCIWMCKLFWSSRFDAASYITPWFNLQAERIEHLELSVIITSRIMYHAPAVFNINNLSLEEGITLLHSFAGLQID